MQMTPKTVSQLIAEAKQQIENLTPDQLAAELAAAQPVLLVDLREPLERAQDGSIGGSVHAPRGMLEFYADPASASYRPEFDPTRRTILYCASGGRSALAVQALRQLGYSNIAHLDGGLRTWAGAGHAVVSD